MSCKICLVTTELFCTQCRDENYCGVNCQRVDWPKHKEFCKKHVPTPLDINGKLSRKNVCATCDHELTRVEECGGCRSIQYCSKKCQVEHWSHHKPECTKRGSFLFAKAMEKNEFYILGVFYKDGTGIKKDDKLAFQNFMKAAHNGDAKSMNNVGMAFLNGEGTEKNNEEALVWLRAAGYAGDITGFHNLGIAYKFMAEDVIQESLRHNDCSEHLDQVGNLLRYSFESFKRAAEMDYAESFQPLADRYRMGLGCEVNEEQALYWESKI